MPRLKNDDDQITAMRTSRRIEVLDGPPSRLDGLLPIMDVRSLV